MHKMKENESVEAAEKCRQTHPRNQDDNGRGVTCTYLAGSNAISSAYMTHRWTKLLPIIFTIIILENQK